VIQSIADSRRTIESHATMGFGGFCATLETNDPFGHMETQGGLESPAPNYTLHLFETERRQASSNDSLRRKERTSSSAWLLVIQSKADSRRTIESHAVMRLGVFFSYVEN
jgi:hypothetical protein